MHEVRLETVTHKKVGKQVSSGLSWKQYEAQFAYRLRPCTMQPHGSPRNISASTSKMVQVPITLQSPEQASRVGQYV